MSRTSEKDRKAHRRNAFRLALDDEHLIAIGQVALRAGMLDNLIDLTAQQGDPAPLADRPERTEQVHDREENQFGPGSYYTGHAREQQRDCRVFR
ncbi:hypothetical protein [Bradyrhizobium sp. I1.7.5]|uniref:hypothetical protein n=1 Tax=Bradyrhizobium sp. I1.7.5 TaxID=3156363 RepID=UPI003397187B